MGIELVKNKKEKVPISSKTSINKIVFEMAKSNGIYLRTLGNIVMLVPPLAISSKELEFLIDRTIITIKKIYKKYDFLKIYSIWVIFLIEIYFHYWY